MPKIQVPEKVKTVFAKLGETLKKVSKVVWALIIAAVLIVIVAIVVFMVNRPYATLFTGMNAEEMSSLLSQLETYGVTDYKVEDNNTVLVPAGQEPALKARLLMAGYPQSGFSYSTYYDNISALSTESERNAALIHDLQDRMGATIRCFDNVRDAVVTISQASDSSYILDRDEIVSAEAGVMITMEPGTKLTTQQATAIRTLVASAVKGLSVESVAISDTLGNQYSTADGIVGGDASNLKLMLEEEYANKVRTQVYNALVDLYGEGNVKVSVNTVVDVSERTVNIHDVSLPDWAADGSTDGEGIKGSQIYEYYVIRGDDDTVGGLVGSETNSDLPIYVEDAADPDGTEVGLGGSGQVDYDNDTTDSVVVHVAGTLTDCTLAVTINPNGATVNYDDIRRHAARAAGIAGTIDPVTGEEYLADKISVIAQAFYVPPVVPPVDNWPLPVPPWVVIAAGVGLLLFVLILVIVLRRRAKKRKLRELEEARQRELDELLAAAALAQPTGGANVMDMQTERSMELRKEIREFADENPEIAAQMIKNWLRGGEDNG